MKDENKEKNEKGIERELYQMRKEEKKKMRTAE
jgi:hypothetical protein